MSIYHGQPAHLCGGPFSVLSFGVVALSDIQRTEQVIKEHDRTMGITNPFSDRYRSTSLSDLTFSSDEESGHASPLTDFSIDESGPPSPLTASGIDEETGKYIAVELDSTELQDAPLYRSFGGRGASKSCDDMLLTALVYQEPDKVCLESDSRHTSILLHPWPFPSNLN